MLRLEAVVAPGLGPGGFCELLMTRGAEDSARPVLHSAWASSAIQLAGSQQGNSLTRQMFHHVRWWWSGGESSRQSQKAHNEHRRGE